MDEIQSFLKKHEDYSLFLLSNLFRYGPKRGASPFSGNYHVVREGGKIVAVFSLTNKGGMLIYSEKGEEVFEEVLEKCLGEKIPIWGVFGHWEFCYPFWEFLKEKGVVQGESLHEKDILYSLEDFSLGKKEEGVRFLEDSDYIPWKECRESYDTELGLSPLKEEELRENFIEKVNDRCIWGLFLDDELVSVADLNAKVLDLGQVGGVYTSPHHRKKGFSKRVIGHLIYDSAHIHSLRKLIIFTGEDNLAARKVYESFNVKPKGYYALFFAKGVE
ncbi:MAG: GNAT family N-acetyltransferase [Chlamydiia bacterium]|nr:GNAT family N-acetyltransferase [Chlamydiia bacterium]